MCMEFEVITVVNKKIRSSVTCGHIVVWYLATQNCIITENEVWDADKVWMQQMLSVQNIIWTWGLILCTIKNYDDTKQLNVYKKAAEPAVHYVIIPSL